MAMKDIKTDAEANSVIGFLSPIIKATNAFKPALSALFPKDFDAYKTPFIVCAALKDHIDYDSDLIKYINWSDLKQDRIYRIIDIGSSCLTLITQNNKSFKVSVHSELTKVFKNICILNRSNFIKVRGDSCIQATFGRIVHNCYAFDFYDLITDVISKV